MGIEVLAQIVFDVARHSDQDAPLKKKKSAAQKARTQDLQRRDGEFRPRNSIPVGVNCVSDDERNPQIEEYSGKYAKDA